MGFTVQPDALRELEKLLGRASEHSEGAKTHLAKMETFEGGEGALGVCLSGHQDAYATLSDWLTRLGTPTISDTAAAVGASAAYYESTDAGAAAELDATYPPADVGGLRERVNYYPLEGDGTARFADVVDPTGHLGQVKDYTDELEGGALNWWDWISPSALLGQAIEGVSEVAVWLGWLEHSFNPQEEIARQFVGDWAGARAAADVLRDVGRALNDVGLNVRWGSQGIDQVWQGNAAANATTYLISLARTLDVDIVWPPIDELAAQYEEASREMINLRDAAVGVINSITDAAVEAAVACGIGGGAAATGVGAPVAAVAALFAGYKISRVVNGIRDLIGLVNDLNTVTSALKAVQGGFAGPQGPNLPSLPPPPTNIPE